VRNKMKTYPIAVLTLSSLLVLSACSTDPYTGEQKIANTTKGALVGSAVGAGIGVLSSSKRLDQQNYG